MTNEEENVIEIVLQEGERHPFCPHRKPSCTRECSRWLNDEIGCTSLISDPEEHFRVLSEYWEEQERLEELNVVES
jgi:hypothetical protein